MQDGPTDGLDAEERGLVAGLSLLGAGREALARVRGAGEAGASTVGVFQRLQGLGREQRAAALAEMVRDVRAPLAGRVEELHPTWLEVALAGEPPGLARAVVAGMSVGFRLAIEASIRKQGAHPASALAWSLDPAALLDAQRLLLAPLELLVGDPAGPLGADLAGRESAELLAEVARRGARTLGTSLAGAPPELRARAMAQVGTPFADELAAASAATPASDVAARDRARDLVAAAGRVQDAISPGAVVSAEQRLRVVGVLALAAPLAAEGPASVGKVAGRLPVDLGRPLMDAAGVRGP